MKKILSLIICFILTTSLYANHTIYLVFVSKLNNGYEERKESKLFETKSQAENFVSKIENTNGYKISKNIIEFTIVK